jgi:Sulfotransferase family
MTENGYDGHNIVFIVGCARSGTTWLQRLLASHPKIHTGQESFLFSSYIGPQLRTWRSELRTLASGRGGSGMGAYLTETEFLSILQDEMKKFLEPMVGNLPSDHLFLEKTPNHAFWIPEIMQMLPKTRIINMLRDGRDVVSSMLAASESWWSWAPGNAFSASRRWVRNVEAARRAMKKLSPNQVYEVRYEQLLQSPELVLQNVSNFLGIEWERGKLLEAVERNDAKVARKSATIIPIKGQFAVIEGREVKQPEGFIRKAKSGSWKEDLTPVEKILTWVGASRTMAKVGYPWILPWI